MFVLTDHDSIGSQFVYELRDAVVQLDRMRFRRNVQRLGEILAYEISKSLPYSSQDVTTSLGTKRMSLPREMPVLVTILRAGLPFFNGFLNYFDDSDSGFIGAFRQENEEHMTIRLGYAATPGLEGRTVIMIDPMLATGRSVVDAVNAMVKNGTPRHLHLASLVAAPEGITFLRENIKIPHTLWTCAVDERLNQQLYIVPGLGDAGDLSFGAKL